MQVITHQFITFGCDHGELECVGRLVFMNVGGSLPRAFGLYTQLACAKSEAFKFVGFSHEFYGLKI